MSIFDKLNFDGVDIGSVQSVDEMTVVPILGSDRTRNIARPEDLRFRRTSSYGSMEYENLDQESDGIVPTNTMVRGQAAQDHAMSSVGIVEAVTRRRFDNACCIEETQGGYLSDKENEEDILPVSLRRALLDPSKRGDRTYSKLWPDINDWLRGIPDIGRAGAHLRFFFDNEQYKKILEESAAEFEPVKDQIGAFVLFSGSPVGLEIMPTEMHWWTYWKWLIRGCYGSELLRLKLLNKISRYSIKFPDLPDKVDDVIVTLTNFVDDLKQNIVPIFDTIEVKKVLDTGRSDKSPIFTKLIRTQSGGGDLVLEEKVPVYLSMII